ncbi:MAG: radical SAM protein [Myxococcales bacterium]|nr:radical SAM protein [Myxococcales bacterium]
MKSFGFQWHLTDRCNLRCQHCYQERFDAAQERPLPDLVAMARAIANAIPDRAISINLTGGEPFLFEGLWPLLDSLDELENVEEYHIITNGTRARGEALHRLHGRKKLAGLKISLEGPDADTNDAVRGPGNFAEVLQNLRALTVLQKPLHLMATLDRQNLESIPALVELVREEALDGVILERFVPLGRGRRRAGAVLDAAGWRRVIELVTRSVGIEAEAHELASYHAFWLRPGDEAEPLRGARCNLGEESMALMPDGTVFPCRRLPLPLGRLPETSFVKILDRLSAFEPARLRSRLTGTTCRACEVLGCAGCRALALAIHGDPYADDPRCPLAIAPAAKIHDSL